VRGVLLRIPRRGMRRLRWAVLVTEQFGKKPQSCRLRNLCEHLPEFFRHVLDQVWSAVKLSRSRLKEFEPSDAIALGGDEGLMRVKGGIEVRLSCHSFCFLEKERVAGMMVLQMRRISIFEHLSPRTMTLISGDHNRVLERWGAVRNNPGCLNAPALDSNRSTWFHLLRLPSSG